MRMNGMKKLIATSLMGMMIFGGSLVRVEATENKTVELTTVISEIEAIDAVSKESEALKNKNLGLMENLEKDNALFQIRASYLEEWILISQTKLDAINALKPDNFIKEAFLKLTGGYLPLELSEQLVAIHSDLASFEEIDLEALENDDRVAIAQGLEEKVLELQEEKEELIQKVEENTTLAISLDAEISELTEKISAVASQVETLSARKIALEEQIKAEEEEKERQRQAELERQRANSFVMPTSGRLTSGFGNRTHPVTGRYSFHSGIDLANSQGTSIKASRSGKVIFAGRKGTYGNLVVIRHNDGFETAYAHLSSIQVRVGQSVGQREQIGKMGSTGRSTGSHLHFEIRKNGSAVNPYSYLK